MLFRSHGPAWANSLFEDFAEFGMGMTLAVDKMRDRLVDLMTKGQTCDCCSDELKGLFTEWIADKDNTERSIELEAPSPPIIH